MERTKIYEFMETVFNASTNDDIDTIITFSGIPSSGKTTFSKYISEKYGYPRIGTNDLSDLIDPNREMERIKRRNIILKELIYFFKNSNVRNSFVFDKGLDRDVPFFKDLVTNIGYKNVYVINLELKKSIAHGRIMARNNNMPNKYIHRLDEWVDQHRNFISNHSDLISLNLNTEDLIEKNKQEISMFIEQLF